MDSDRPATDSAGASARSVRVWDLPTRLFHWLTVPLVAGAWATQRLNWIDLHVRLGETLLALVLFRLMWGCVGSETARFRRFLAPPAAAWRHLRHLLRREPDLQVGHNAAGGWMVLLLLVRPPLHRYGAAQWRAALALGAGMAVMSLAFFLAIERLPQHLTVALEFCGPLAVAALGARGWRALAWPLLAAAGIGLLVSGDAHAAGGADPVGIAFVTGSISAIGMAEGLEYSKSKDPLLPLLTVQRADGTHEATVNLAVKHGVRTAWEYAQSGDIERARALTNPDNAPHVSFVDMGGHGYSVVTAAPGSIETEFVCVPRPITRATTPDGGPIRYRVVHRAARWHGGKPKLEQRILEGDPKLSV